MGRFEGIFAAFYIIYWRGVFLLGGKLLPFQGVLFILEHQFYQGVLSFGSENFCCMNFALNSLKKNTEMMVIANILLPLPLIMKI